MSCIVRADDSSLARLIVDLYRTRGTHLAHVEVLHPRRVNLQKLLRHFRQREVPCMALSTLSLLHLFPNNAAPSSPSSDFTSASYASTSAPGCSDGCHGHTTPSPGCGSALYPALRYLLAALLQLLPRLRPALGLFCALSALHIFCGKVRTRLCNDSLKSP